MGVRVTAAAHVTVAVLFTVAVLLRLLFQPGY